jgi:tetratricopeptide (TPR) repeat protein
MSRQKEDVDNVAQLYVNKAKALLKTDPSEALRLFNRAIEYEPKYLTFHLDAAKACMEIRNFEQAIIYYDSAIKLASKDADSRKICFFNKSVALISLGSYEKAIVCLDEAIKLNPLDAQNFGNKAHCLGKLGRYQEALNSNKEAIRLQPDNQMYKDNQRIFTDNLARQVNPRGYQLKQLLQQASALAYSSNYEGAVAFFHQARNFGSLDANSYGDMAHCLHKLGRHQEALDVNTEALRLQPDNALFQGNQNLYIEYLGYRGSTRLQQLPKHIEPKRNTTHEDEVRGFVGQTSPRSQQWQWNAGKQEWERPKTFAERESAKRQQPQSCCIIL